MEYQSSRRSVLKGLGALSALSLLPGCIVNPSQEDKNTYRWKEINVDAPFKMPAIKVPLFPERQFNIKDYGAKAGGDFKNTQSIALAIEACHLAGGGQVVIPKGKWLTGKIHFQSNVNLHLEKGATLLFSDDPLDYLPAVLTNWEGMECYNYSPLIYAYNCKNIAITGQGELLAKMDTWKIWFARPPEHMQALANLYHMAGKDVPVKQRQMAVEQNNLRPHFIQFNRCENILIEDVRIRNSPFWTVHMLMSKHIVVRGIDVVARGHNNDGVNPEMSENVLIENCIFEQGDDGVSVKSGRNRDAWRLNQPTKNIVIRNNVFKAAHQLLAVGSELSGGIENIYVHDCSFPDGDEIGLRNLVFIKTNHRRGGYVKNIHVKNIKAGNLSECVLRVSTNTLYQWKDLVPTFETKYTEIKDIFISDIIADSAKTAFKIKGDSNLPVSNIYLKNISVAQVLEEKRITENAINVIEENVSLGGR